MILWITGNSGAGKTTIAKQLKGDKTILIDGDEIRRIYPTGFSPSERVEHNIRIAHLAKSLHSQGFDVIVSVICPFKVLRTMVKEICGCSFLYLKTEGKKDRPYEYEEGIFYLKKS